MCLELAAGGSLRLFKNYLIEHFKIIDINELSEIQMHGTYTSEEYIKENQRHYHIGKIGERFFCGLKDVPLDKKYDLVIGHYALGYLSDDNLY